MSGDVSAQAKVHGHFQTMNPSWTAQIETGSLGESGQCLATATLEEERPCEEYTEEVG
jgi:hypothetical protein